MDRPLPGPFFGKIVGVGQRCRVHFTHNAQDLVPRSARSMVASAIGSVFEQPDGVSAREQLDGVSARDQLDRVIDGVANPYPGVAALLADAEPDRLTHFTFPVTHRIRIRSTNLLERLDKKIKRRPAVVGIFPNRLIASRSIAREDDELHHVRRLDPGGCTAPRRGPADRTGLETVTARVRDV